MAPLKSIVDYTLVNENLLRLETTNGNEWKDQMINQKKIFYIS